MLYEFHIASRALQYRAHISFIRLINCCLLLKVFSSTLTVVDHHKEQVCNTIASTTIVDILY